MNLLLSFASLWLPPFLVRRELARVAWVTTMALDGLLAECAPPTLAQLHSGDAPLGKSLAQRRMGLARAHRRRVAALVEALGQEEAVQRGRAALFPVGLQLGQEVRARVGMGDSVGDLLQAAHMLYRVLGIDFSVQWQGGFPCILRVHRCALSAYYAGVTCMVLSATDEGVVRGLNPHVSLRFQEYLPAGTSRCTARLEFA